MSLDEPLVALTVAVPKDTPWQPDKAAYLAAQIINLLPRAEELMLYIAASSERIRWGVMIPVSIETALKSVLYGLYPEVQLAEETDLEREPEWWYEFKASGDFFLPFAEVDTFKATDPLAVVVNALSTVQPGEQIIYFINLTLPSKDYRKELDRQLIPSVWQSVLFGLQQQIFQPLPPSPESLQEERMFKELAFGKVSQPLAEAKIFISIQTPNQQRANEFVWLIYNTLKQYHSEFNGIIGGEAAQTMVLTASELAGLWHMPTIYCVAPGIVWAAAHAPLPGAAAQQADGIPLGIHSYRGHSQEVRLSYSDRQSHVNIVGKTGVGKSTLIQHLVRQDILNGKCVGVIDPKGDLITKILAGIPPERERDVILFDVADRDYPIGLNLLAMPARVSPDEIAGRVLALIKKFFADDWPGEQTEGAFYAAILTLLYQPGSTLVDIARLFNEEAYRQQVLPRVDDLLGLEFWNDYQRRSPGDRLKIATPVITRARRFYRDRTLQRIICQSRGLNFRWMIDTNKIFLASLVGIGDLEAHTLGALLISKFQLAVMSRTDISEPRRQPVYLYIDEVQNFTTHSLGTLFSQGRSFGLSLVTANQYFSQLPGETLEAVLGNVGTNICFAVGHTSASHLTGLMRPEFTADNLQQLDKFTTVVKMQREGQTLPAFLLHTLPPPVLPDATTTIDRIRQHSRQSYGRPASEVDAELRQRYGPGEPAQPGAALLPTDPTQLQPVSPANSPPRGDVNLDDIFE